jgi:hypothetical protein
MKKLLLTALILASGAAHADLRWLTDSSTDTLYRSGVATYSDNNGLVATSWFSMFSKTTAESGKWLIQVHCDTGLVRTIRTITYMNNVVDYNTPENWLAPWRNPIPGSFEARFRVACTSR